MLNMCISASWLVLAVLLLRLLLKKAPAGVTLALWLAVAVRLLCPVTPRSVLSLIPSAETVSSSIVYAQYPSISTGFTLTDELINPVLSGALSATPQASVNPVQLAVSIAALLWAIIAAVLLLSGAVSAFSLKLRLRGASCDENGVYRSERVSSPFVFGFFRARIYMPLGLSGEAYEYALSHERAHIARYDHITKAFAFALLCVYWYNPLLWLAYTLFCADIERACDRRVVRELDLGARKAYSRALLDCSSVRSAPACPLAFGEVSVRSRIKSVLSYKKPALWVSIASLLLCAVVAVCFLTSPNEGVYSGKLSASIDPKLDAAVSAAILEHTAKGYLEGDFLAESHYILGSDSTGDTTKVFILYDSNYYVSGGDGEPSDISGCHLIPAVLTFSAESPFVLKDFEEAQDGALFEPSIERLFPADCRKMIHKCLRDNDMTLSARCLEQAKAYFASN